MSDCPREPEVAAALANGAVAEELRRHLAGCAACGEAHSVALDMRYLADRLSAEPALSAASMWWRLSLRMRREKARRAEMPLVWMGRIFYSVILLMAALLVALFPHFSRNPAAMVGVGVLIALSLTVGIALWGWSRSKI